MSDPTLNAGDHQGVKKGFSLYNVSITETNDYSASATSRDAILAAS